MHWLWFWRVQKEIILKDVAAYGSWKAKLTSILGAENCLDIVYGTEPDRVAHVNDDDNIQDNKAEVDARLAETKDFKKQLKKAASFITQSIDDSIVMSLDVHARNLVHIWNHLATDCNTVTPAQRSAAWTRTFEEACLKK